MRTKAVSPRLAASLVELDQLTDWERRPRDQMRVGLEPISDLLSRLDNPHHAFRTVHVSGTKGKGSTCSLVEAGLVRRGILVGRYGSPHVHHICERVSLNGKAVEQDLLAEALDAALAVFKDAHREASDGVDATWFDLLTAAAFLVFQRAGVRWAVVETGLGGRLDSTNVVSSEVAVITNVELEHVEVLGRTRRAIAIEKAGIIKSRSVVVTPLCESDAAGEVVYSRAREMGCRIVSLRTPACSTIRDRNIAVAAAVLDAVPGLGTFAGDDNRVGRALLDDDTVNAASLPGRLERLEAIVPSRSGRPAVPVVVDGAHVAFNLSAVVADILADDAYATTFVTVVSIASDKDAAAIVAILARHSVTAIFTSAGPRSRPPSELAEIATRLGMPCHVNDEPVSAYIQAVELASDMRTWVLVTGSLYLVGLIPREI